jgi:DNA mismatch endonuclease, patch repair protein
VADIFSKKKRSQIMASVLSTETKPERAVRKFLFSKGYRFRKNLKSLPGKPDIVLPKYKTAILVHGCFWHGHKNCDASTMPKSNKAYWKDKIKKNIERDKRNKRALKKLGWNVFTIWECKLNNKISVPKEMNKILTKLESCLCMRN